ncbi:MAG: V-type synthase subunit, partial [Clostridia bacterium]|nr:V-type synthase subunit [Clostridia bacterium]
MAGRVIKVSGPLVVAEGMADAQMYEVVRVSDRKLIGEIIEIRGDKASIQVYEETSGLGPGEPVYTTGESLSVELAPGLIESIFDGIQRPLDVVRSAAGDHITRGIDVEKLNKTRKWNFVPKVKKGDKVIAGDILGIVQETSIVEHRILVPNGVEGTIEEIEAGDFTIVDTIAKINTGSGVKSIQMLQKWPVRRGRPYKQKLAPSQPMITGQRVIDTFFPVAKGGTACIPGPF